MIDSLKIVVKFLFFSIIDRLAAQKPSQKNGVLLVRLDAIGDYILFRNFIEQLAQSGEYGEQKITLLGNHQWKDIAENLDASFIDEFIWLNVSKFGSDPSYRYKTIKRITQTGYATIINSVYSRELLVQDLLIKHISANHKIGQQPNTSNLHGWHYSKSNACYTQLIDASGREFEFYRNKTFFEKLLGKEIYLQKPDIKLADDKLPFTLPTKYVMFFIGASKPIRVWPAEYFAELANHLSDEYNLEIVVCGGPGDEGHQQVFDRHFRGEYTNLVGKTSLVELLHVIGGCSLMVSNETSAPHMAVALGVPDILVISNGNHLSRFVPYPKEITGSYHVVFHPEVENSSEKWNRDNPQAEFISTLDVSEISVQMVWEKLNQLLQNKWHAKS